MKAFLKSLAPRDLRALIALWASIGGTMALTLGVVGIVLILWKGGWSPTTEAARIDKIGLIAVLVTLIMGVTMVSLGLAINRRSVKGSAFGASFEATGGDDDADPQPLVTTTTTTAVSPPPSPPPGATP